MKTLNILGFDFNDSSYDEIIQLIDSKITLKEVITFLNVNPHILNETFKKSSLKNNLKKLSFIFADGIGVYLGSKILYGKNGFKHKITGTDLYYKILSYAEKNQKSIFFFGGGDEAVSLLKNSLNKNFPDLRIAGIKKRETIFTDSTLQQIKTSDADILFLGLGSPYQEEWLAKYSVYINIPTQVAMGSGIEFLSGNYSRAPKIFQKTGLEWFYRFLQEPARLWKRYFFGNPLFLYRILIQKFTT